MSLELPQDNYTFPLDDQYEVAAWRSTFKSLSVLFTHSELHEEASRVSRPLKDLAQVAFKDPLEIASVAFYNDATRRTDFIDLGILTSNTDRETQEQRPYIPASSLLVMLEVYHTQDSVLRDIAEEVDLERLDNDIDSLAHFHHAQLHTAVINNYSLVNKLRTIQRDNLFYIAMWDADRSFDIAS